MAETYYPFDPNTRKPAVTLPPNACDCQFHVLGPREKYPVQPNAGFEMPTATFAEAKKMHKALGIARGLIVQATTYGLDHACMIDALAESGPSYKGCAIGMVLAQKNNDAYIAKMNDARVCAGRFNLLPQLNMVPSPEQFKTIFARLRELKWFAKIQSPMTGIMDTVHLYEHIEDIPIVIDHLGRFPISEGLESPTVKKIVELLKRDNFWVMLSNGHKISKAGKPWADIVPFVRKYIEAAPDRVIWSSDWPHPLSKTPPPNDGDLVDLLAGYTINDEELKKILVDNPAKLIGF
ncbi:2-pyrone-4,6-dicarboxylate hydrolase [Deltaproteobacteria bacterium]|nr:2-pyrone-4,6-dicarboxylate hydrolase [Deltaproteobacteria bacterium]